VARELMTGVEFADSVLEAVRGADACVIVTEWPEFAELDWTQLREPMPGRLVVDGRNFLDPDAVREAGFAYEGIGR
jgi:UDPglucose 6-dehydrogenase